MGAVIRVLFVTGFLAMPQMRGGSQRTSDAIIRGLIARGHDVRLFAALKPNDLHGYLARIQMKLLRRRVSTDLVLGYKTHRSWDAVEGVGELVGRWRPDVAVALTQRTVPMGAALQDCGVPLVVAFQDNEFGLLQGDPGDLKPFRAVANSHFTARRHEEKFGVSSQVIYPVIDPAMYAVGKTGDCVTFVNPDRKKGYDLFLALAKARPAYKFILVPGWPLPEAKLQQVIAEVSRLPNVDHVKSQSDMRVVYARTKVLLAPSQIEEGYGRVATEAQFSGIPVLGSDRGGLPEAIGPGGVMLPADAPMGEWLAALDRLMLDPAHYADKSAAARSHASREAIRIGTQIDQWERLLESLAKNHSDCPEPGANRPTPILPAPGVA